MFLKPPNRKPTTEEVVHDTLIARFKSASFAYKKAVMQYLRGYQNMGLGPSYWAPGATGHPSRKRCSFYTTQADYNGRFSE